MLNLCCDFKLGSRLVAHVLRRDRGDRDVYNAQLERVRVLGVACTRPLYRVRISISPQARRSNGHGGLEADCYTAGLLVRHTLQQRNKGM